MPAHDLLLAFLGYHEHRAQTIPDLAARTGLSVRQVQAAVEQLRRDGVAICTSESGHYRGVWLTTDPGVVRDQYRRKRRRALHQLANLRRMLRTADAMEGKPAPVVVQQRTLWGDA